MTVIGMLLAAGLMYYYIVMPLQEDLKKQRTEIIERLKRIEEKLGLQKNEPMKDAEVIG